MSSDVIRLGAAHLRNRMYLPAMRRAPLKTSYLVLRTPDYEAFVTKLRLDTSGEPWKVVKGSALACHTLIGEFGSRAAADECASGYERALQQQISDAPPYSQQEEYDHEHPPLRDDPMEFER